jgi:copper homeostasis protein
MGRAVLEVIALDARDAVRAHEGGADRLEVVADMASDGLSPSAATVEEIKRACPLPLMVMLRARNDFAPDAALNRIERELREAGADGFVFGFLDPAGAVDAAATGELAAAVAPLPWTFHRAVDHAADPSLAWAAVRALPGIGHVLTAGSPRGVGAGLGVLRERCEAGDAGLILAGGGLALDHLAELGRYGVRAFHAGSAVRPSWSEPVDAALVARWRSALG